MKHDLEDHCRRAGCNGHWKRIGSTEHPDSRKCFVTEYCSDQAKKHAADHHDQNKDQCHFQTVDKGCGLKQFLIVVQANVQFCLSHFVCFVKT